jgi:hypothetical protein
LELSGSIFELPRWKASLFGSPRGQRSALLEGLCGQDLGLFEESLTVAVGTQCLFDHLERSVSLEGPVDPVLDLSLEDVDGRMAPLPKSVHGLLAGRDQLIGYGQYGVFQTIDCRI